MLKYKIFKKKIVQTILIKNYDTDKKLSHDYLRNYELFFSDLVDQEIKLLELGVYKGGSLLMWRDYFKKGEIIGLDINNVDIDDKTNRIKFYQGSQNDIKLLSKIALENAPDGFDIIIDDASHIGRLTQASFWHLFKNHLKKGGIYVIEDWGTGYWDSWPDGSNYKHGLLSGKNDSENDKRIPSHDHGMVGFIKELIDECGMRDITHEKFGISPHREPKIEKMQISHGIVFIIKA